MLKGNKKDYFFYNKNELLLDKNWLRQNVVGFSSARALSICKRFEAELNFECDILFECLKKTIPPFYYLFKRLTYNVFLLDLICAYRGYRHCHGLPVRGQRTWTNAVSAYKANTFFRKFRVTYYQRYAGATNNTFATQMHLAEQINLLWKIQWESEWKEVRRRQKRQTQNNSKTDLQVDLQSMSNMDVGGYTRRGTASKKKLYKQKKNQFTLGFDVGFSKQISIENNVIILEK